MKTVNENKPANKTKDKKSTKKQGNGVAVTESTPVTEKVKPKAGSTLHNEGTNFSYEEQR
jgi:hypothetical protein